MNQVAFLEPDNRRLRWVGRLGRRTHGTPKPAPRETGMAAKARARKQATLERALIPLCHSGMPSAR